MGIEVGAAMLISSLIGAGSTAVASKKASDAADDAEAQQLKLREEAQAEADRIAMEARPEEETATIEFGTEDEDEMGSANDFLVSKTQPTGLTSGSLTGGLGFS